MTTYRVVWEMDIDADTPQEAAEKALAVHRDPESIATAFEVTALGVDLGRGSPTVGETVQVDLTYPEAEPADVEAESHRLNSLEDLAFLAAGVWPANGLTS